jgi:hypothetical protein
MAGDIALWARLHESEMAYTRLNETLQENMNNVNLLGKFNRGGCGYPGGVVLTEANGGYVGGIIEMLLQSHIKDETQNAYILHVLPALPKAWPDGSCIGLRARGGFIVDLKWREGQLSEVTVHSNAGKPCKVLYGDKNVLLKLESGQSVTLNDQLEPVNQPPTFTADPMSGVNAIEDAAYSDTIAGSATDSDVGDTLTYSIVSGSAWLSMAPDGILSGTPDTDDVGASGWTVEVSDGNGGADQATLNINVINMFTGKMGLIDLQGMASNWLDDNCGLCGGANLGSDNKVSLDEFLHRKSRGSHCGFFRPALRFAA